MWTDEMFGVKKPVIALLHLDALPGDPGYCGDMTEVTRHAMQDLEALEEGGVDGVLVANEFSAPFSPDAEYVTVAAMAEIVGELKKELTVPFGVNVVMSPMATIELAAATGARFCRSAFTGAYTGDYGVYISGNAKVIRRKKALGLDDLKLFYKVNPEGDVFLNDRDLKSVAQGIARSGFADALCVSGTSASLDTDDGLLKMVSEVSNGVPVFCNTGCNIHNVREKFAICDGTCMGSGFKYNGDLHKHVDLQRVKEFMAVVKEIRKGN